MTSVIWALVLSMAVAIYNIETQDVVYVLNRYVAILGIVFAMYLILKNSIDLLDDDIRQK